MHCSSTTCSKWRLVPPNLNKSESAISLGSGKISQEEKPSCPLKKWKHSKQNAKPIRRMSKISTNDKQKLNKTQWNPSKFLQRVTNDNISSCFICPICFISFAQFVFPILTNYLASKCQPCLQTIVYQVGISWRTYQNGKKLK
jgi:hypothetical protein